MSDAEQAAKQVVRDVMPLVRIGAPVMEQCILAEIAQRVDGSMRYVIKSSDDQRCPLRLVSTKAHHKRDDYKTIGEFLGQATGRMHETLADGEHKDAETHRDAMEIFTMELIMRVCQQAARDLDIDADDGNWFDEVLNCVSDELALQNTTEHHWLTYISEMPISALPLASCD